MVKKTQILGSEKLKDSTSTHEESMRVLAFSIPQAAAYLGVTEQELVEGKLTIPSYRHGDEVLYMYEDMNDFLRERAVRNAYHRVQMQSPHTIVKVCTKQWLCEGDKIPQTNGIIYHSQEKTAQTTKSNAALSTPKMQFIRSIKHV